QFWGGEGSRGVGAHASGIGALVAVEELLMVLRQGQDAVTDTIRYDVQRHFPTREELLYKELLAGIAKDPLVHDAVDHFLGLCRILCDNDPFPSGKTICLNYLWKLRVRPTVGDCVGTRGKARAGSRG